MTDATVKIQGLRTFLDKKTQREKPSRVYFEGINEQLELKNHFDLFERLEEIVMCFPKRDLFNLFYTMANVDEENNFVSQDIIAWDLDSINKTRMAEYHEVMTSVLKVKFTDMWIVDSGNGLHYIVPLAETINDSSHFQDNRSLYKRSCELVNIEIAKRGLSGHADSSIFDTGRILRLPMTTNKKPGKVDTRASCIQRNAIRADFSLSKLIDLPMNHVGDYVDKKTYKTFQQPDTEAVLDQCGFLKYCKEKKSLLEPEWYVMMGVLGWLENGRSLVHEYSTGDPRYDKKDTDIKLDHALSASGPRCCESIRTCGNWDGCTDCPHFGKVVTPIQIKSEEFLASQSTGFWDVNNKGKKTNPNIPDLAKFFEQKYQYISIDESAMTYTWCGTHWEYMPDKRIKSFAYDNLDPKPRTSWCDEFLKVVQLTNLKDKSWLEQSATGKTNLKNGVLDVKSMELRPHSPQYGFTYCLEYEYDKHAECPNFMKFLSTAMSGDKELINVLCEFGGYVIANGDPRKYEKALVLYGGGKNGKSVYIDILTWILGQQNVSATSLKSIGNPQAKFELVRKILNVSEESPKNIVDSDDLKAMISGGMVQVKSLYKDMVSVKSNTKFVFSTNELPTSGDVSHGYFRKLLLIPFNTRFDRSNPNTLSRDVLYRELKRELPGILNMFITGYQRLELKEAFTDAAASDILMEEYRQETDTVYSWCVDCVVQGETDIAVTLLYKYYNKYTLESGQRSVGFKKFVRRMRDSLSQELYPRARKTIEGRKETFICNIAVEGETPTSKFDPF